MPAAQGVTEITETLRDLLRRGIPVVAFNGVYDFTVMGPRRATRLTPLEARPPRSTRSCWTSRDRFRKGKRTLSAVSEHYGVTLENAHTSAAADACRRPGRRPGRPVRAAARRAGGPARAAGPLEGRAGGELEQYLRRKDPQATVSRHWPVEAER